MSKSFDSLPPDAFFVHKLWPSVRIKMLWVTDDPIWGGYGPTNGFHLGQALGALQSTSWTPVRFDVVTAHRQDEITCQLPNFRFDQHDLSTYSQIWLFGIETKLDPLTESELNALGRFMNAGGGVFATGDHQRLGQPLAGSVPRVRSMRRWFYPDPGPNGEPMAPAQSGPARLDTIVDTDLHTPGNQGEQSDAMPQTIRPRWYARTAGEGVSKRVLRYPHPILCGPAGPITYLPDHMHEGRCEVPSDLTRTFTINGDVVPEYPHVQGHQQVPEIIAWGTSQQTEVEEFGVLAAYDGHPVGVGRVLVDSTWHHWFNVNLFGFINATTPGHATYDPAVVPKWEAIKAYYRNVPSWLADSRTQSRMAAALWHCALTHVDVRITFRDRESVRDPVLYFWQMGRLVTDALRLLTNDCEIQRLLLGTMDWVDFQIDPWDQRDRNRKAPPAWLDLLSFEAVALGGAADRLLEESGPVPPTLSDADVTQVLERARRGAISATGGFLRGYVSSAEDAKRLISLAPP